MNVWSRLRDVVDDVAIELNSRRSRALLLIVAIALSTGTLTTALGLSETASKQVDADLAAVMIDQVTVTMAPGTAADQVGAREVGARSFPDEAIARVRDLDGVIAAGLSLELTGRVPGQLARLGGEPISGRIVGVTPGFLTADNIEEEAAWFLDTGLPVAYVGGQVAEELGLPSARNLGGYTLALDGVSYSVLGVLSGQERWADTVLIPYRIAREEAGSDHDAVMLLRTEPGAGSMIAGVVRTALQPAAPEDLRASQVIDAGDLRAGVSTQLDRLVGAIGALLLVLSVLLVANAMIVSVTSRTQEIGLRRAIGASRLEIAVTFLVEGASVGLLGGLAGGALACWAVIAVSLSHEWSALLELGWPLAAAVLGLVTGLVSALYPALRASAIAPASAVRSD